MTISTLTYEELRNYKFVMFICKITTQITEIFIAGRSTNVRNTHMHTTTCVK